MCGMRACSWIDPGGNLHVWNKIHEEFSWQRWRCFPAVVCVVIMMVNGNVGTGVAVAGAFSLVRFRSVPGSAKEIGAIFLAMCSGSGSGNGIFGLCVIISSDSQRHYAVV